MSQYVDTNTKSFPAGGAISQYARVVLGTNGTVTEAGITGVEIGTALYAAASGEMVAVKLRTGSGTHKMIAAGALTANDPVFSAANGTVGDTASTAYRIGTALEDVGTAGDIVEVLYVTPGVAVT